MQEQSLVIEQCPQDGNTGDAKPRQAIAQERLFPRERTAILVNNTEPPGFHGEGSSAVTPEPSEVARHDSENIKLKNQPQRTRSLKASQSGKKVHGHKYHRE